MLLINKQSDVAKMGQEKGETSEGKKPAKKGKNASE
jgi:hypothetical protein